MTAGEGREEDEARDGASVKAGRDDDGRRARAKTSGGVPEATADVRGRTEEVRLGERSEARYELRRGRAVEGVEWAFRDGAGDHRQRDVTSFALAAVTPPVRSSPLPPEPTARDDPVAQICAAGGNIVGEGRHCCRRSGEV